MTPATARVQVNPEFTCDSCWADFQARTGIDRAGLPGGWFEIPRAGWSFCPHGDHHLSVSIFIPDPQTVIALHEEAFGPLSPEDKARIERLDREEP